MSEYKPGLSYLSPIMHYEPGVTYFTDENGWRVEAGCKTILASSTGRASSEPTTSVLEEVTCLGCKNVYALEFLALIP